MHQPIVAVLYGPSSVEYEISLPLLHMTALGIESKTFWSWVQCPILLATCSHIVTLEQKLIRGDVINDLHAIVRQSFPNAMAFYTRTWLGVIELKRDMVANIQWAVNSYTEHCMAHWYVVVQYTHFIKSMLSTSTVTSWQNPRNSLGVYFSISAVCIFLRSLILKLIKHTFSDW